MSARTSIPPARHVRTPGCDSPVRVPGGRGNVPAERAGTGGHGARGAPGRRAAATSAGSSTWPPPTSPLRRTLACRAHPPGHGGGIGSGCRRATTARRRRPAAPGLITGFVARAAPGGRRRPVAARLPGGRSGTSSGGTWSEGGGIRCRESDQNGTEYLEPAESKRASRPCRDVTFDTCRCDGSARQRRRTGGARTRTPFTLQPRPSIPAGEGRPRNSTRGLPRLAGPRCGSGPVSWHV